MATVSVKKSIKRLCLAWTPYRSTWKNAANAINFN